MEEGIQYNHLYFGQEPSTLNSSIPKKYHPEALIIEKCGPMLKKTAPDLPSLRFSVVSQDNLSAAIHLAKRDIQKMKWEAELKESLKDPSKKTKLKPKPGRAPTKINSKEYLNKLGKRKQGGKQIMYVREKSNGANNVRSGMLKVQSKSAHCQNNKHEYSVTSIPGPMVIQDPVIKVVSEITRLQSAIKTSLQAMRQMEENAQGELDTKPEKLVYAEDINEERKRASRAEGQATRLTHMVYMLSQQLASIKDPCNKYESLPKNKKLDMLNKVAAAHRSVLKVQQTFLQNMPYFNIHKEGMPKSYFDLASIIQQLMLCCDNLQIEGDGQVTDVVYNLISKIIGMEKQHGEEVKSKVLRQQTIIQKDEVTHKSKEPIDFHLATPAKHFEKALIIASPDRQAVLRAGMDALVRARDPSPLSHPELRPVVKEPPVPPLALPTTPRTPRGSHKGSHREPREQHKRGVLIPQAFQQKKLLQPTSGSHYADPTFSSRSKEVPKSHSLPPSPRGKPSASSLPTTPQGKGRYCRNVSQSPPARLHYPSPRSRQKANVHFQSTNQLDTSLNQLLRKAQMEMNTDLITGNVINDVMDDVAQEVQRLEEEESIYEEAHSMQSSSTIENLIHRLKEMETEQDSIRRRWATIEYDDNTTGAMTRAVHLQTPREDGILSPPPIILQERRGQNETDMSDKHGYFERQISQPAVGSGGEDAWIFTKPKATAMSQLRFLHDPVKSNPEMNDVPNRKPTTLYLAPSKVRDIQTHRTRFYSNLTKLSHQPVGKFNPWTLMDDVADSILQDCLQEVCQELEDINSDIASHVYNGEFALVPQGTGCVQSE